MATIIYTNPLIVDQEVRGSIPLGCTSFMGNFWGSALGEAREIQMKQGFLDKIRGKKINARLYKQFLSKGISQKKIYPQQEIKKLTKSIQEEFTPIGSLKL